MALGRSSLARNHVLIQDHAYAATKNPNLIQSLQGSIVGCRFNGPVTLGSSTEVSSNRLLGLWAQTGQQLTRI